jgi:trans-feruloyl-CoA hydratase/vanillin synthase
MKLEVDSRKKEAIIMANYETILVDREDGVVTVTLNRPHKKNAMSPKLHYEMVELLSALRYDKDLRVLVITGKGDSFSAGEDLKEFFYEQRERMEFEALLDKSLEWRVRILRSFPVPTIAMVNGWCFGGAFSIVAGCDIAIAADEAMFGLSEVNFGHFPGGPVSKQISAIMRPREAIYYILTGDQFNGKRAAEIGLITYSVPRERLEEEVQKLVEKLCAKQSLALRACKEAYRDSLLIPDIEAALSYSGAKSDQLSFLQNSAWKDQGIKQFIEGSYRPGKGPYKKDG